MIAVLLLAAIPFHEQRTDDECDTIELNTYYDSDARKVFAQLIGWEIDEQGRSRVKWWRINPEFTRPSKFTVRIYSDRKVWWLRCHAYRETHTQVDLELENREKWPREFRRGLRVNGEWK